MLSNRIEMLMYIHLDLLAFFQTFLSGHDFHNYIMINNMIRQAWIRNPEYLKYNQPVPLSFMNLVKALSSKVLTSPNLKIDKNMENEMYLFL